MSESVNYLNKKFSLFLKYVYRYGPLQLAPGQSSTGYGSKISTDYMIRIGEEKTFRRVYTACYSNVASFYVLVKGKKFWIRDHELEEAKVSQKEL